MSRLGWDYRHPLDLAEIGTPFVMVEGQTDYPVVGPRHMCQEKHHLFQVRFKI